MTVFQRLMQAEAPRIPEKQAEVKLEMINPDQALAYLLHNRNNRPVIKSHINTLANDIRLNKWQITNSAIAFDDTGNLIDGQHRLLAIAQAGKSVPCYIMRGIDADAQKVIDKNKVRSLRHDMTMRDEIYSTRKPAVVRVCALALMNKLKNTSALDIRTEHIFDMWAEPFLPGIAAVLPIVCRQKTLRFLQNASVSGALVFAHKAAPDDVELFTEQLVSGIGLHEKSPALILRNHFLLHHSQGFSGEQRELVSQRTWTACKAHIDRKEINQLRNSEQNIEYFRSFYTKEIAQFSEFKLMLDTKEKKKNEQQENLNL